MTLWQRLLESPYDDVRLALVPHLEAMLSRANLVGGLELSHELDPERLRLLWASVLLNVRRGGRVKPGVVQQVAQRLAGRPDEAEQLLPLLGLALRSVRAPERRAALAAVVRLVEDRPDAISLRSEGDSRVAMGLSVCDHRWTSDPEGGRAVLRDHHAAAIRRGRT